MKQFLFLFLILFTISCKNENQSKPLTANEIIDKSIEVSGGKKFSNSDISFKFRDINYRGVRMDGKFSLIRMLKKDEDFIVDTLSNEGFTRAVNFEVIPIADSLATKYSASVNSVHYFSVLPYGLNDKAVNKELIGEEQIKNKEYYKIKVTFSQDGGGEDYKDVFVYWVEKQSFKLEYLAYSYNEVDGIGMRFREAYNERYVNGLRFVDYNNFKPKDSTVELLDLGKAFENNQLQQVSKIELENVKVELLNF